MNTLEEDELLKNVTNRFLSFFERIKIEFLGNEYKSIDWIKYSSAKSSNYDCIIPFSGGKDSHYQTHIIKNEF
jgi:tRNA(Ile)-lysidine synthase TilS/MesJ